MLAFIFHFHGVGVFFQSALVHKILKGKNTHFDKQKEKGDNANDLTIHCLDYSLPI